MKLLSPLLVCAALLTACGDKQTPVTAPQPAPRFSADLARTSHGVAHVRAENFLGLGYGLAYAYTEDNVCMLADSMLTVRGERSRYFGGAAMPTKGADGNIAWP